MVCIMCLKYMYMYVSLGSKWTERYIPAKLLCAGHSSTQKEITSQIEQYLVFEDNLTKYSSV